ncbi:MAG: hypothetical protein MGU50_21825 [Trichodesmium sp. MAG_R02]|jgi:hypothetical protein|nr:hypothetical protein [Trichodesmium sp. MAG_R02]
MLSCFLVRKKKYISRGRAIQEKKRTDRPYKTTAKVAAACETSNRRGAMAWLFPRAFRPGRMPAVLVALSHR